MSTHIAAIVFAAVALVSGGSLAHPHGEADLEFASRLSNAFQHAAETIRPSVVRVATAEYTVRRTRRGRQVVPIYEGTGSGLIVSGDGHIVTNHHVVADADTIRVWLHDGRQFDATAVGTDAEADLAVIRIEAEDLTPATLADPTDVHVGQWVLAVGSPFGLSQSFSAGIISGTGRSNLGLSAFEHMIQTDAAINPGNSGGPLIDLHGRVLGLNSAIKSMSGTGSGVGFAIPVDMVHRVTSSLIGAGHVERGYFGVSLGQFVDDHDIPRCIITHVESGLPADTAGLMQGDVVLAIDERGIRSIADARHAIAVTPPGQACLVTIRRGDASHRVTVTPMTRPTLQQLRQRP